MYQQVPLEPLLYMYMVDTVVGAGITAVIKTLSFQGLQANKQVTTVWRNNRNHFQGALGEHKMGT